MIEILGVSKSEFHSSYELKKEQDFFKGFRTFLGDIDFDPDDSEVWMFGKCDETDPKEMEGHKIIEGDWDITEYVDSHTFFKTDDVTVDVVFGKESIFVIIASKEDKQTEISDNILKFCAFKEKQ